MPQGVMMQVKWDTRQWDKSVRQTIELLGDMTPIMDAIAHHMEASVKQTLTEGGPPQGKFKPVLRGGTPLVDTGGTIRDRIHVSGVSAKQARIGAGFKYAHVHQFGMVIRAKDAEYLRFQVGGRWARVKEVTIPARPFMTFRPEDPQKIGDLAADFIDNAFGQGAGAFWRGVL